MRTRNNHLSGVVMFVLFRAAFCFLFAVGLSLSKGQAQEVTGMWKSYKEETGKPRALVRVFVENGILKGKVIKSLNPKGENSAICTKCPKDGKFASRGDSMIGLTFIKGLRQNDDGRWVGDDALLDPDSGKIYDAKIWVPKDEPDKLKVRGFMGFFYRTQTWNRVSDK